MAHSKAYIAFCNKLSRFDDDIDFVDVIKATVNKSQPNKTTDKLFLHQRGKHTSLARYTVNQHNRELISLHLRATVYAAYIKDVYEEVSLYLKSMLLDAYGNASVEPARIMGEHKVTMQATEILQRLQDGTLAQHVIDQIFQCLENERSTTALIEKTCRKLGVEVEKSLIDRAVHYMEIRHKLVHTDGVADRDFQRTHSELQYNQDGTIKITYQVIVDMRQAVKDLITALDEDAIKKRVVLKNTTKKRRKSNKEFI